MIGLILCGGKGARLAGALPVGLPKCALVVGGFPLWRYAYHAALTVCRPVLVAPGMQAIELPEGIETVADDGAGTVNVIRAARRARPNETVLVLNGDTLLFGRMPGPMPPATSEVVTVLGVNALTDQNAPAYRLVGPGAKLLGRDLEEVTSTIVDASDALAFLDAGTPQGLARALEEARRWS